MECVIFWSVHVITGKLRRRAFQVRGVNLWNAIPLEVRKKDTVNAFKTANKKYFLAWFSLHSSQFS